MSAAVDLSKTYPVTFAADCGCNTNDEVLIAQIDQNIRRGLPQLQPHLPNGVTALLVCGGPSLATTEKELVEEYWRGGKIVAVNGGYDWCIQRNLKPSAVLMLDAREFNSRFIETPVDGCKYLLASQCHPSTFDRCRDREAYIWHALGSGSDAELALLDKYYFKRHHPVTMGTTIGIRAISVLRMLGFQSLHIFGLDSCWLDDEHHAYSQVENDNDTRLSVWLRPDGRDDLAKRFNCSVWHCKQAQDFQELIQERGGLFRLNVHGPGLIAEILRTGAKLEISQGD